MSTGKGKAYTEEIESILVWLNIVVRLRSSVS